MSAHAAFGASGASRYMACPGSYRMTRNLPPGRSSRDALVGTACHDIVARILTTKQLDAPSFLGKRWDVEEEGQTAQIEITAELVAAMEICVAHGRRRQFNAAYVAIEQKFSLDALEPPAPMFGTSDLGTVTHWEPDTYEAADWKFGVGVEVRAVKNPQTRFYTLGGLLALPPEIRLKIRKVRGVIVQPRLPAGPATTSETLTVMELLEWAEDLIDAVKLAVTPDAPLVPGLSQCRWCGAAPFCPALKDHAMKAGIEAFKANPPELPPDPTELSDQQLGELLKHATLLKLWVERLRQHTIVRLSQGSVIPGWKLVAGQSNRQWGQPEKETIRELVALGLTLDDITEPPSVRSPAQIEKVLDKAQWPDLQPLIIRSTPGPVLAPADDKRLAIQATPLFTSNSPEEE